MIESIFVKDFAYHESDALHYGVKHKQELETLHFPRNPIISIPTQFQDGPPWKEDPDLRTPHIDKDLQQYQFSIASSDEIHGKAIALFDFEPENDNEVRLKEGQLIWISYRHGQGWLVAEDDNGETGLVPEEYVELIIDNDLKQVLPEFVQDHESDWVDEEEEEKEEEKKEDKQEKDNQNNQNNQNNQDKDQLRENIPIKDLKLE